MFLTILHTTPNRRHFHTFDATRFFACFKVFLLHLPLTAFPIFLVFSLLLILYLPNYNTHYAEIYSPTILGLCFAVLIMFTLHPKTRFKINDNHILSQLGLYTYSFYLFHTIIISALFLLFKTNEIHLDKWVNASIFGVLSFSITLFCSFISYHLFEKQFLKLKKLF